MVNEEQLNVEASFEQEDLEAVAVHVKSALDIRNRRYGFPPKIYENCFVGNEAVKVLVAEEITSDEADAVHIGERPSLAQ